MRTLVFTCDDYLFLLPPFAYLWNKYFGQDSEVLVAGYCRPDFTLPPNFQFRSIEATAYPAERWSNGVLKILQQLDDELFIMLLEDYWLNAPVAGKTIEVVERYLTAHPEVLRCDLTSDRLQSGQARDVETFDGVDFVETPHSCPYQMSLQAAVVRRTLLQQVLPPDISPWSLELYGNKWLRPELRVLGTKQAPMRYINAKGTGLAQTQVRLKGLQPDDQEFIARQGWIPSSYEIVR